MPSNLTVRERKEIQWPEWTDSYDLECTYVDLTAKILCELCDGSCQTCQCRDPGRSWYANSVRYILPSLWPNGPLEMIATFNKYAVQHRLAEKDKVRDPVSSAFSKLSEHAAFWIFVKQMVQSQLPDVVAQPEPASEQSTQVAEIGAGSSQLVAGEGSGVVCGPSNPITHQETSTMKSDVVNPFGATDTSGVISYGGDLESPPELAPAQEKSNTGLYVAAGLGLLLIGGIIAADMYRTSKGIRPVYVAPPMVPMGAYY